MRHHYNNIHKQGWVMGVILIWDINTITIKPRIWNTFAVDRVVFHMRGFIVFIPYFFSINVLGHLIKKTYTFS